jgi:hypothetical protein
LRVKVNIEIPLFKGDIDTKYLYKWLQELESYFVVNQFFDEENIAIFTLKFVENEILWW